MEHTRLGTTDITIPRLCIGGMSFGKAFPDFHQWVIDQEATQAVIVRALELGVNFIDTANVYSHGTSEEFIGTSLKNLGVKREDVVLASKVYFNEGHLSREAIEREIDGTLLHYRDKTGLEADAVIVLADGRWAPIEVKLGSRQLDEAAAHLRRLRERVDANRMGEPSFLAVVTAGATAYRRDDGVLVVPLACLRP